jgi:tRNA-modifying protein YgfZ
MTIKAIDKGYIAANQSVAFTGRSDRVRIELTGPDRAKVLHNLTTNDIKRLGPGRGCEAFLTSGQGRTLALLLVHAEDDRILLRSDPGTAEAILSHLTKYGMFEDMTPTDVSSKTSEWHLFGPAADDAARSVGLPIPEHDLGLGRATIGDANLCVIREAPTGRPGLTIVRDHSGGPDFMLALKRAIDERGGSPVVHEGFEALRIEAGTPLFGQDLTAANLPQEVDRDARAISFVKGCYLGQETVARLDAMGHVNKILVGAVAETDAVPPPGATLRADGKDVGVVTSSAFSPGWSRGVALGYAKVGNAKPGSALVASWDRGEVGLTVRARPMIP